MKTEQEIEEAMQRTYEDEYTQKNWSGMSYQEGVRAALEWVLEKIDDDPTKDE